MDLPDFKDRRTLLVIGLVALFFAVSLILRLLPLIYYGDADPLAITASDDPLYNLRLVELTLANHLQYAWFDPMTYMPYGTSIYWGPLTIYIGSIACVLTGAATRPDIMRACLFVMPLAGAAMVPVVYWIGKKLGDWKTGLLAAGFTAVVGGEFFAFSLYGYFNHRDFEVLFSSIFCLAYLSILLTEQETRLDLNNFASYKKALVLSVLAGIAYVLGLLVMPTMILFALIVGVFTVIQFILDNYRDRQSDYLLLANTVIFAIAIIGLLIFGIKDPGLGLSVYSIGHIYAYLLLIFITAILYLLKKFLASRPKYWLPGTIIGAGLLGIVALFVLAPQLYNLFIASLYQFFGQVAVTETVMDAHSWSTERAWEVFNYGLVLLAAGLAVVFYKTFRSCRPKEIFFLVWSFVILFSTIQHVRYEYYLAINIALLAAICIQFVFEISWGEICVLKQGLAAGSSATADPAQDTRKNKSRKDRKQKKAGSATKRNYPLLGVVAIVGLLGILFAYSSFANDALAGETPYMMNPDWEESLHWLGNNTPATGVDYLEIYDPDTFQYPASAYGVMSWWDYGHMITYISERIPNANPFQQGVIGPDGSAAYFLSTNETAANEILDTDRTRYVITDIMMDTSKLWAMATWYNETVKATPYQTTVYVPTGPSGSYAQTFVNTAGFYPTMVSRLHNFDGSMAEPSTAYYVVYAEPAITHLSYPTITESVSMNVSDARDAAARYNANAPSGYSAAVIGVSLVAPLDTVPALSHYRLVHESPSGNLIPSAPQIKYVKTFEYVKGAHIAGSGIIEVPVTTNTGRNFTYRQESINGEFVVPYATTGTSGEVRITGPYRIVGTGATFEVPESAVEQGLSVS